eukprot:SAG31_NODE_1120_length_9805_cov_8.220173_6_plen_1010_part_00
MMPCAVSCTDGMEPYEFWESLPDGKPKHFNSDSVEFVETEYVSMKKEDVQLYRVADVNGQLEIRLEGHHPLRKQMLNTNECFVIFLGDRIFVWVGRRTTAQEKKNSIHFAEWFLNQRGLPHWLPVERVVEGGETADFKRAFDHFDPPLKPTFETEENNGGTSRTRMMPKNVDSAALQCLNLRQKALPKMIDAATGQLTVWLIEGDERQQWPLSLHGHFYGGDCALVLYTYVPQNEKTERLLVYAWQGKESSPDQRKSMDFLAAALAADHDGGNISMHVFVEHGQEPEHFIQLFGGKLVIHKTGKGSSYVSKSTDEVYASENISLFHICGNTRKKSRALQVDENACALNSGDSFILLSPGRCWVWYGAGSSIGEREVAKATAYDMLQHVRELIEVDEGQEPAGFWQALGGKTPFAAFSTMELPHGPRLFRWQNEYQSRYQLEEIIGYTQDDLDADCVFLLDIFVEVFIWLGLRVNAESRDDAINMARDFISAAPDGRNVGIPITLVSQSYEPSLFTCHFLAGWEVLLAPSTAAGVVAPKDYADPCLRKMAMLGIDEAPFYRSISSARELVAKLGLDGIAPESEVRQIVASFEYYDMDSGGYIGKDDFRKLASMLVDQGLVRKGAERACDLANAFEAIDSRNSGYIDAEDFVSWWFQHQVMMRAKLEAKGSRPKLAIRNLQEIKKLVGIPSVPESKLQIMRDVFLKHDADGYGVVGNEDFRFAATELGLNLTPNGMKKALAVLDADGSGTVEFQQFLGWYFADIIEEVLTIEQRAAMQRAKVKADRRKATDCDQLSRVMEHARHAFQQYDSDHSGTISRSDFVELCYDMGYCIEDRRSQSLVLSILDVEDSGRISFRSFFRWWKSHKNRIHLPEFNDDIQAAIFYFKKYDRDLSGSISESEYAAMCSEMGWEARDIDDSKRYLAVDGNASISFNKFLTWYSDDGLVHNLLSCYDLNKNGKLDLSEFAVMCADWKLPQSKATLLLQKFDKDGDGELGLDDLRMLMKRLEKLA